MLSNHALVEGGIVRTVVVLDSDEDLTEHEDDFSGYIKLPEDSPVSVAWIYKSKKFSEPTPESIHACGGPPPGAFDE